jgi:diguanylate cyclase (GGDEF)-like protein
VNDTYGHAVGDATLQAAAGLFARTVRQTDVFGRVGGEEFVVLLPETAPAAALIIAERLRQALEQQIVTCEGHSIQVTASFGVTGLERTSSVSLEVLTRSADRAVYDAKAAGRNHVVLRPMGE